MQKNSTILHEVTPEQINSLFQGLQDQLKSLQLNFQPVLPSEYLTRGEVAEMLKCDLSTIHKWTVKGKLFPYGIGNRVYYKRAELETALLPFGKKGGSINE